MLPLTDDELRRVSAGVDDLEELIFKVKWHTHQTEKKVQELINGSD